MNKAGGSVGDHLEEKVARNVVDGVIDFDDGLVFQPLLGIGVVDSLLRENRDLFENDFGGERGLVGERGGAGNQRLGKQGQLRLDSRQD